MPKKINWEEQSKQTRKLIPEVDKLTSEWFKAHPDWTGWVIFSDYPPRFHGKFEIVHINQLSDKRKEELGELTTSICKDCGLMGKKIWDSESGKNRIEYKFWLPIK
jgi:hypothetical protein